MRNVLAEVDAVRLLTIAPLFEAVGCDFPLVAATYCEQFMRAKAKGRALDTVRVRDVEMPADLLLKTCMLLDAVKVDGRLSHFTDLLVRYRIQSARLWHINVGVPREVWVTKDGETWRGPVPVPASLDVAGRDAQAGAA